MSLPTKIVAQAVLDDYLDTYREYLPQFWR